METSQKAPKQTLEKLTTANLGRRSDCQANQYGDFMLCIGEIERDVLVKKFFIYDLKKEKIVFYPNGEYRKVFWEGDSIVKALKFTRAPSFDDDEPLVYNVYDKVKAMH